MTQENLNRNTEDIPNSLEKQVAELHEDIKTIKGALFNAKEVMTLKEAAIFLGMTNSSLYKMTHNKVLPYYRPNGKMVYFEKSELLKWVRQAPVASATQIREQADNIIMNLSKK